MPLRHPHTLGEDPAHILRIILAQPLYKQNRPDLGRQSVDRPVAIRYAHVSLRVRNAGGRHWSGLDGHRAEEIGPAALRVVNRVAGLARGCHLIHLRGLPREDTPLIRGVCCTELPLAVRLIRPNPPVATRRPDVRARGVIRRAVPMSCLDSWPWASSRCEMCGRRMPERGFRRAVKRECGRSPWPFPRRSVSGRARGNDRSAARGRSRAA